MATIFDRRNSTQTLPVWEAKLTRMSWGAAEHGELTESIGINGIIKQLVIVISAATDGTLVCPVAVVDSAGVTVKTFDSLADATTHVKTSTTDFGENELAMNGFTITAHPDKVPGTSGLTVDITVRGI